MTFTKENASPTETTKNHKEAGKGVLDGNSEKPTADRSGVDGSHTDYSPSFELMKTPRMRRVIKEILLEVES